MKVTEHNCNDLIEYPDYRHEMPRRLVQVSSVDNHLWVGDNHHLNEKEVEQLVVHLQKWLKTGRL
jgi:hypothetical protein